MLSLLIVVNYFDTIIYAYASIQILMTLCDINLESLQVLTTLIQGESKLEVFWCSKEYLNANLDKKQSLLSYAVR